MNFEALWALAAFAFVSSITPGPNNLMLMASGANFGFRRTVPHMLGVSLGFMLMLLIIGGGLLGLFDAVAHSYTVLKFVSVAYLVFLAWKIATAAPAEETASTGSPLTFVQAALFQWVNPKAWVMGMTAISVYSSQQSVSQVIVVSVIFGVVNLPCVSSWAALGQQIRQVLTSNLKLRVFNVSMALMLLASLYPIFGTL